MHREALVLAALLGLALPAPALAVTAEELVGKWGLAGYFNEKDAGNIEASARAQCNAPYTIARGPSGGVMMHLPDATKVSEVVVKTSLSTSYIGPAGAPGGKTDREIVRFDGKVLVLKWLDPADARRYGTMVFARCGK